MAKIISFISGKGGVGTSHLASAAAMQFASAGKKCLLIDYAFGSRSDDIILNLTSRVLYNISDVLEGKCKVKDAIVISDEDNLPDFIASSPALYPENQTVNFKKIVRELSAEYDFIVFDINTMYARGIDVCIGLSDILTAVTTEDYLSVRNTALCVRHALDINCKAEAYLCINKVLSTVDASGVCAEDIIDEIGAALIGIIPFDPSVSDGQGIRPQSKNEPFEDAVKRICIRLSGMNTPLPKKFTGRKFFGRNKIAKGQIGGY